MTRIEFKRKCTAVGPYCFAVGKVESEGEHFRVTLKRKASKMAEDKDRKKCRHGLEDQNGEYA